MSDSHTPARRSHHSEGSAGSSPAVRRTRRKVDSTTVITAAERVRMIETAAYYRAERRGFVTGHEAEDWLSAEAEIDALIGGASSSPSDAAVRRATARRGRAN
jgi:hypothetical protein